MSRRSSSVAVRTYVWSRLDLHHGLGLVSLDIGDPTRVKGHEVAVDRGQAWAVTFRVELDQGWRTRGAQLKLADDAGERTLLLEADGEGNWLRDGRPSPELQGCLDIDIAATPFTNTFAIRRLGLSVGETAEIRAAWVGVPRLENRLRGGAEVVLSISDETGRNGLEQTTMGQHHLETGA